jgi:precorrin-2 dehydrogenase/sirohydrochlorin ferrochelatase
LLIDIDLNKKKAVILGGGAEAELKAFKLTDAGAVTTVVARRFTRGLQRLSESGHVKLVKADPATASPLLEKLKPKVLFISTGHADLDARLADLGRSLGILLCVVDSPQHNDFNMPAIARVGSVRIGVSTDGKSPAVAKILRQRIERMITPEDLLQVELQASMRGQIRDARSSHHGRKDLVYEIIKDPEVSKLLKGGDLKGAKRRASGLVKRAGKRGPVGKG